MLSNFLITTTVREKIRVKLALTIPTGAPTLFVKEIIQTPPLVALKTSNFINVIKSRNISIYFTSIKLP